MSKKEKKPRSKFYICSGKGGMMEIEANTTEAAAEAFAAERESQPKETLGPYYKVKGTEQKPSLFISLKDAADMQFTGSSIRAKYNGFPCTAQGMKAFEDDRGNSHKDNEAYLVILDSKDSAPNVRRPRTWGQSILPKDALEI